MSIRRIRMVMSALLILCLGLQGCSFIEKDEEKTKDQKETKALVIETPEEKIPEEEIIVNQMTLEEKVAQMFVVIPEAIVNVERVTQAGTATKQAIEKYPVGGIIYMGGNIQNPTQITKMLQNVNKYSTDVIGLPMFLCIDEEGGTVVRINSNTNFPVQRIGDMAAIGATGDTENAREAGEIIGSYLTEYGFNVDFAPDADVLTNNNNTVVKRRAFGSEPQLVADMASSFYKGLKSKGVCGSYKHFPGHGNTDGDTHEGFSYSTKTLDELWECELIPFEQAIEDEVDFIMTGHLSLPNVTGNNVPASLSYEIVTGLLREEMGYEGLIITDALNMGAIANIYSSAQSCVKAIQAGNDMVLMPTDFVSAYQGVLEAVKNGEISEEQIYESVCRIVKKKLELVE